MRHRHTHYQLEHGFIHNWLVAGPQSIPVEIEQFSGEDFRQKIAQHYYEPSSGIDKTPIERGPLTAGLFHVGDYAGSWNYYACQEDHLVDHSAVYPAPYFLRSWAYTQLNSKTAQEVVLVLKSYGPADVWINGEHGLPLQRLERVVDQHPGRLPDSMPSSYKALLQKGMNKILVRFEAVAGAPALRECVHAMALQVCKLNQDHSYPAESYQADEGLGVSIPTLITPVSRRDNFERVAAQTYILQDVFESTEQIRLHWPEYLEQPSPAVIRLVQPSGSIYAEATVDGTAGDQVFLNFPYQIPPGPYRIIIMPRTWEYYNENMRITREIDLWSLGKSKYSTVPYGTYASRRQEALTSAAHWKGLFAQIAKMALNQWSEIDIQPIQQAALASPQEILGVLGMLYRFGEHPQYPQEHLLTIDETVLGYPYEQNAELETDAGRESNQILTYAAEILAGQRYPDRIFSHSGKSGQWHREKGERLALEWLAQRGKTGFSQWDSQFAFASSLIALSHLVDLAEAEPVWDMAAVVMDKLFISLAINSFQGVFGSTHGQTCAQFVKGGYLEPTSGIARLMWGAGFFNHHIAGTVSLACMEKYELPSIISDIAVAQPVEMWSKECHAIDAERVVNKVTYKTPDTMLCSAQDYSPGQKGSGEHIWQATLGVAATVFVTHPACSSENDARQPNFWAGNAVLPRVAQWKDVLIAVYHLPEDDWMGGPQTGFTHAYFPAYAFNEYALRQDGATHAWAFARKDDGYLALTAAKGLNLTRGKHYALRELRSYGHHNIWLCHLGRAAIDGDFAAFQEKILALNVQFTEDSVLCTTLRDEVLSFGWQGPFLRDGQPQALSGFAHYDGPYATAEYPSQVMEIRNGETILRLGFEG